MSYLDLDYLSCRQELTEVLRLKSLSHEDCIDWLKAHEAHFSRYKTLETANLTGIPMKSIIGPVNFRLLKELGSPGLNVEPLKHRTSIARIRVAIPAQLGAVEKLFDQISVERPRSFFLPRDIGIFVARSGANSNVDSDNIDEVGDAVRARIVVVREDERSSELSGVA